MTSAQRRAEVGGGDRAGMGGGRGERVEKGRLAADVVRGMQEKNASLSDEVWTAGEMTPSFPFG